MSNRNAQESAVAFDLLFSPESGTLTLGGAEIDLAPTPADQWINFPDPGPKGFHRMATSISSFTYHIGGVNRLPGRMVFADGMYKVVAVGADGGGAERLEVTVKVSRINGAGEADYEGDYSMDDTMGDDGVTRGERVFRMVLEEAGRNAWRVVGGEGVEFQDQEVVEGEV